MGMGVKTKDVKRQEEKWGEEVEGDSRKSRS